MDVVRLANDEENDCRLEVQREDTGYTCDLHGQ